MASICDLPQLTDIICINVLFHLVPEITGLHYSDIDAHGNTQCYVDIADAESDPSLVARYVMHQHHSRISSKK